MGKNAEIAEKSSEIGRQFSSESLDKYSRLFADRDSREVSDKPREQPKLAPEEAKRKYLQLLERDAPFYGQEPETNDPLAGALPEIVCQTERCKNAEISAAENTDLSAAESSETAADKSAETKNSAEEPDYKEKREPNSSYEFNGNTYETDDNGQTYKRNGELLPDSEYTINGSRYRTDGHGRIVEVEASPKYTKDNTRDSGEQREVGGDARRDADDGGHLLASILGGSEGSENLVPMRSTVNRGDYKKMEYEIAKALQEGKDVKLHIEIEYEGDSRRPSKIKARYETDGKTTETVFDNVEGSTDLLGSLADKIGEEDYSGLEEYLADMNEDGYGSVTSVKVEYDENGQPAKVTVGILDEESGEKTYIEYEPRR